MSIEDGKRDDNSMGPLFDAEKADEAAEEGIARAASPIHRQMTLAGAQELARHLAVLHGRVTADDLARVCADRGVDLPRILGNAMGAVFRGPEWELVGYEKSERVRRHGNVIRVWRLK